MKQKSKFDFCVTTFHPQHLLCINIQHIPHVLPIPNTLYEPYNHTHLPDIASA